MQLNGRRRKSKKFEKTSADAKRREKNLISIGVDNNVIIMSGGGSGSGSGRCAQVVSGKFCRWLLRCVIVVYASSRLHISSSAAAAAAAEAASDRFIVRLPGRPTDRPTDLPSSLPAAAEGRNEGMEKGRKEGIYQRTILKT